jgi:hypothetical protein
MDIEALDRRCKELQLSLPLHTTCDRALWYRTMNQANQNWRTYGHHLHTHICQKSYISQKIIWLWHTNTACKKMIHLIVEVELHPWCHHFRKPAVGLMVVSFALIHRCGVGRWLLWHLKAGEGLNHLRHQHKIKSEVTANGAYQRELSEDRPIEAGERPSRRWQRGRASGQKWGRSFGRAAAGEGVWSGDDSEDGGGPGGCSGGEVVPMAAAMGDGTPSGVIRGGLLSGDGGGRPTGWR